MPKQVIDREKLVAQAYAIASRDGISALSVRKVAAACGIAVGSVYGYFPTKADLTAAVLTRFFEENLSDELCAVRPGERFTSYVRRFREALCAARADMSVDWFAQMRRLPSAEQEALEAVRAPMLAHIERGLARAFSTGTRPWIAPGSSAHWVLRGCADTCCAPSSPHSWRATNARRCLPSSMPPCTTRP